MADNFARQKSTRWVKADKPSYGGWGDDYDDYDEEDEVLPVSSPLSEAHTNQAPVSNSPLVLTIDRLKPGSEDELSDTSFEGEDLNENAGSSRAALESRSSALSARSHSIHLARSGTDGNAGNAGKLGTGRSGARVGESSSVESSSINSASVKSASGLASDTSGKASSAQYSPAERLVSPLRNLSRSPVNDLLPPTPTYQSEPNFPPTPDLEQSDRSYFSDADSIQREPESLNLGSYKENAEPLRTQTSAATEKLVDAPVEGPTHAQPEALVLSIDRMNTKGDSSLDEDLNELQGRHSSDYQAVQNNEDDDDWGYNSSHSSNLETQSVILNHSDPVLANLSKEATQLSSGSKHKVDTKALDSLIKSLLRMEDLSSIYGDDSLPKRSDSTKLDTSAQNYLPTLDSIHDFSLPDFENHFLSGEEAEQVPIKSISEEGLKSKHESFVTNVRQPSIKKAPPTTSQDFISHSKNNSQSSASSKSREIEDIIEERAEANQENVADRLADLDLAKPPKMNLKAEPDVSRRSSTMSTATFNMGAWKPNTNKFRDQFVNDNDNESLFNVSISNKSDAAYKKFTGTELESNYAESVTNASFLSVPETIDANLHKIKEDQSEEDELPDTISSFGTPKTFLTMSSPGASLPSVLKEHQYENGKFLEQSPHSSVDKVSRIDEEGESNTTLSDAITPSSRSASFSATKAAHKKYPVYNWKSIMSTPQPVDRINLLKKARYDEEMYDTGLSDWLKDVLKSTESSSHIQIGKLATHAYQNAQHSDIRRHTSIRSKVNQVRDKMDSTNFGKASNLGKKFFSRGKKLMKTGE